MVHKVLKHIDREEIIKRLTNGESVRNVELWLKEKYPKSKHLWITSVSLQKFRAEKLNLTGQVLKDIQEKAAVANIEKEKQDEAMLLQSSQAYHDALNGIVDTKLDVAKRILELDVIIAKRIEFWYNKIASGEVEAARGDKELRQYMDRLMPLLGQYKKFVEGMADKSIDYNINVTVMNDQISIIRDVIRDTIAEFSPEVSIAFMEKLTARLQNTEYNALPAPKETVNLKQLKEAEFEVLNK